MLKMLELQEDTAKRRKISEKSDSKQKNHHFESDEKNETPPPDYLAAFHLLVDTVLKSREHLLPYVFYNAYAPDDVGNYTIMFDDIGKEARVNQFIPPGLQGCVRQSATCESESKYYGFVTFLEHRVARMFLCEFNGKKIPEINFTYKLSWAPCWHPSLYGAPEGQAHDVPEAPDEMNGEQTADVPEAPDEMNVEEGDDVLMEAPDEMNREQTADVPEAPDEMNVEEGDNVLMESPDDEFEEEADDEFDDTLTKIEEPFKSFYNKLHEKAHEEKRAYWKWPVREEKYFAGEDDGCTTYILLYNIHAAIEESQLSDLFGFFGKCTVSLFDNGGFGIVKFEDRESAYDAYENVEQMIMENDGIMENEGVFYCAWAFEHEETIEIGGCYALEEVESGLYMKVEHNHECVFLGGDCPYKKKEKEIP